MSTSMLVILSILGGIAVALQGQFMGILDQRIGSKESVFITYAGGDAGCAHDDDRSRRSFKCLAKCPLVCLHAGALGLVIVGTFGYTVPRLGLTTALTRHCSLTARDCRIDRLFWFIGTFSLRTLNWPRMTGLALFILGARLVLEIRRTLKREQKG